MTADPLNGNPLPAPAFNANDAVNAYDADVFVNELN